MSPRGKRVRVAVGIFDDAIGRAGIVKVAGTQHERRWPAGTDLAVVQKWQRRVKARAEFPELPAEVRGNTLRQDAATYLALLPKGRTRDDAEDLLNHWLREHGDEPKAALTPQVIHAQMLAWVRDGAAATSCNHRRRVLVGLWKAIDGPGAVCPAKQAPKLPTPRRMPSAWPWPAVLHFLKHAPANLTGDRLRVLAHTGWPHAVLKRVTEGDLHLSGPSPYALVRPRRKGGGVPATDYPLTPDAAKALRSLVARDGLGDYSNGSLYKSFRLALTRAKATWTDGRWPVPEDAQPYDLRRSFLSHAYATGKDARATQHLGLHASMATTSIYIEAAVVAAARELRDKMAAAGTPAGTARRRSKR